jgi:putative phosphoribosyl transferase
MLFASRNSAGRALASKLAAEDFEKPVVAAIPNGGLTVASPVAEAMGTEVIVCPVVRVVAPEFPSLGIGAVFGWDGGRAISDEITTVLGLRQAHVERSAAAAAEILSGLRRDLSQAGFDERVRNRDVVLVDDCIATGSTMLAGVGLLRTHGAQHVVAATPAISAYGYHRLSQRTDLVHIHRYDDASFSRSVVYPNSTY